MSHYRIILRGVMDGQSVDQVVQALAHCSKKTPDALRLLLTNGKDVVAKRTTDVQRAVRYKQALEKIGCVCFIQAEITAPMNVAPPADSAISVFLTNFTDGLSPNPSTAREYQYASPPLAARMRAIVRTARMAAWIGVVVLISVFYYGWKNLY